MTTRTPTTTDLVGKVALFRTSEGATHVRVTRVQGRIVFGEVVRYYEFTGWGATGKTAVRMTKDLVQVVRERKAR